MKAATLEYIRDAYNKVKGRGYTLEYNARSGKYTPHYSKDAGPRFLARFDSSILRELVARGYVAPRSANEKIDKVVDISMGLFRG